MKQSLVARRLSQLGSNAINGRNESQLRSLITKFQILFDSDWQNWRESSLKILPILRKMSNEINEVKDRLLLERFLDEI